MHSSPSAAQIYISYWGEVLSTLRVFQMDVPLDPIFCLLGVLEEVIPEEMTKTAFSRA